MHSNFQSCLLHSVAFIRHKQVSVFSRNDPRFGIYQVNLFGLRNGVRSRMCGDMRINSNKIRTLSGKQSIIILDKPYTIKFNFKKEESFAIISLSEYGGTCACNSLELRRKMGGTAITKLPGDLGNCKILVGEHLFDTLNFLADNELFDGYTPGF